MLEQFLAFFGPIPLSAVVGFFMALGFIIFVCVKGYKMITSFHDSIQDHQKDFADIQDGLKEIKESQEKINSLITDLIDRQEKLEERQTTFEKVQKEKDLTDSMNRLLHDYRFYTDKSKNPLGQWTSLEAESFWKMFGLYEKNGGNGYMHSTVQPEMNRLQVIDVGDLDACAALADSRK